MSILNERYNEAYFASLKDNPDFAETVNYLHKCYEEFCIGEIPTTKFNEFTLFHDVGDRAT